MTAFPRGRSLNFLVFLVTCSSQLILGLSDDSSDSKDAKKPEALAIHNSSTTSKVVILLIVIVGVSLFSFFLFKLWQRKKREEQYARLLKLFEEDDELELELGLRN